MPSRTIKEGHRPRVSDRTMHCHSWSGQSSGLLFQKTMGAVTTAKWNHRGRTIASPSRTRRPSKTLCLEKTTRRVRVHVQTVGLNAETKKERHRADGEMFLLTFPFIGLVRYARLPGVRYKKAARMIERLDLFRVFQITSTQFIALALANLKCSLRPRQFMSKAAAS